MWLVQVLVGFLMLSPSLVECQNPALSDPDSINAGNNIFYFDKNSDCNNAQAFELYDSQAIIYGAESTTQEGPTTCTIILMSTSQYEGTILDIQVESMNIQDCDAQISIYDGYGAQLLLVSYDCRSSLNQNMMRFVTNGDSATFVMTRQSTSTILYDVEIRVNPIRSGTIAGIDDDLINYYIPFDKFSQDAIVGMVGGFYGLVLIVCLCFIIYFARAYRGLNKEWETHQLAALKTEERFEMRQLVPEERYGARPRVATTNHSYSDREDEPDKFKEKVITSRARPINRNRDEKRDRRPPSYEEAVSDEDSERSSEEESSSDGSVGKKSFSSDEERSRRRRSSRSGSETPSGSESEEEESSSDGSASSSSVRRRRNDRGTKNKPQGARARRPPPSSKSHRSRSSRDTGGSERSSEVSRPRHKNKKQQHQPPPAAAVPPMPYGAPGQFVPMMAAPPYQMVPGYPPPHALPPQTDDQGSRYQVQPTDPPVYSYLVRRGYTPMDQNSTHSSARQDPEEPDLRLSSGVDYMKR